MRHKDLLKRLPKEFLRQWLEIEEQEYDWLKEQLVNDETNRGSAKYVQGRINVLKSMLSVENKT